MGVTRETKTNKRNERTKRTNETNERVRPLACEGATHMQPWTLKALVKLFDSPLKDQRPFLPSFAPIPLLSPCAYLLTVDVSIY